MSGLIALAMLIGWAWLVKVIIGLLAGDVQKKSVRLCIYAIGFPLVFISPLADEILAIPQVKKICSEGAVLHINSERAKGKAISVDIYPAWKEIGGTIVPIKYSHFSYKIVGTNEEVANFNIYHVSGGFLSRYINFNSVHSPWIIDTTTCHPAGYGNIQKKYGFNLVD